MKELLVAHKEIAWVLLVLVVCITLLYVTTSALKLLEKKWSKGSRYTTVFKASRRNTRVILSVLVISAMLASCNTSAKPQITITNERELSNIEVAKPFQIDFMVNDDKGLCELLIYCHELEAKKHLQVDGKVYTYSLEISSGIAGPGMYDFVVIASNLKGLQSQKKISIQID